MAVPVYIPQKQKEQPSFMRRLFALGVPLAGAALGGPVGAGIGAAAGSKLAGDDALSAVGTGAQEYLSTRKVPNQKQETDAINRKLAALQTNPAFQAQEGLNALKEIGNRDLTAKYAPPLIAAQIANERGFSSFLKGRRF